MNYNKVLTEALSEILEDIQEKNAEKVQKAEAKHAEQVQKVEAKWSRQVEQLEAEVSALKDREKRVMDLGCTTNPHNAVTKVEARIRDLETQVAAQSSNANKVYSALGVEDGNWMNAMRVAESLRKPHQSPTIGWLQAAPHTWIGKVPVSRHQTLLKKIEAEVLASLSFHPEERHQQILEALGEEFRAKGLDEFRQLVAAEITKQIHGDPIEEPPTPPAPKQFWGHVFRRLVPQSTLLDPSVYEVLSAVMDEVEFRLPGPDVRFDDETALLEWQMKGEEETVYQLLLMAVKGHYFGTTPLQLAESEMGVMSGVWSYLMKMDSNPHFLADYLNTHGLDVLKREVAWTLSLVEEDDHLAVTLLGQPNIRLTSEGHVPIPVPFLEFA